MGLLLASEFAPISRLAVKHTYAQTRTQNEIAFCVRDKQNQMDSFPPGS